MLSKEKNNVGTENCIFCRHPEKNLVIDGLAFAHFLYNKSFSRGLCYSHNPYYFYDQTLKFIKQLRELHLKVIRVYMDAINNPEKGDTYISRRKEKQRNIKVFWESDLTRISRKGFSL